MTLTGVKPHGYSDVPASHVEPRSSAEGPSSGDHALDQVQDFCFRGLNAGRKSEGSAKRPACVSAYYLSLLLEKFKL